MNNIFKNIIVKNVLSGVAVAFFGSILLNVAFMLDFLFQTLMDLILKLITPVNLNMATSWYPPIKHFMFVAIIGFVSWFIFRSKLNMLIKAIYLTVPLAVVYITIGMFLYRFPIISISLSGFFSICLFWYFYKTKKHWLYFYALVLINIIFLVGFIFHVEI
jgi:hypothetical protein